MAKSDNRILEIQFDMKAVQDNVNRALNKKERTIYYTDTKNTIAKQYAFYIRKYVPKDSYNLVNSTKIRDGVISYYAKSKGGKRQINYAKVQYAPEEYGYNESFWDRKTPETYSHWNRHLTTAERQSFYDDVKRIIVERMNNDKQE